MSLLAALARACVACVLVLVFGSSAWGSRGATYFVATDGLDTNSGTEISAPFRTIHRAATKMLPGDTCLIRGGIYRETLAPMHSGTSNAPITFTAYSNEVVTISGADLITGWRYWTNGIYSTRVDWNLGMGYNQLFMDGQMLHQAALPRFGSADLLHPNVSPVFVSSSNPNVITSSDWGGRPANYWAGTWFSGGVGERWSWQCARVASSSGNSITLDASTRSNPWFHGTGRGFLWGSLNVLDQDKEWHLQADSMSKLLYVRLADDANRHSIELKKRKWCVWLNGLNHIVIRNLQLRSGAVMLRGNGNVLEDCQARFLSHFLRYTWGYAFDGGLPEGGGVVIKGTNNIVRGCTISETAGSGIISRGSKNIITRNWIHTTDCSGTYACAIRLNGVQDQVSLNTAYYSGRDILQPGGAGHAICLNNLFSPGQMCRDLGVIYIWGTDGRCPTGSRTRIAHNWVHDQSSSGSSPLIYLDNWCRNFVVDHNVCWNGPRDAGIRVNAPASGHQIYNNTLFNCDDIGTHTYDAWPNNNPDPAFWRSDINSWSSLNNLFLGSAPGSQLLDWKQEDFRLQSRAPAINAGVVIPGYTDGCVGLPDHGAYEFGVPLWKAGADGWYQPRLNIDNSSPGFVTLTAPPGAAYFQLLAATNLGQPLIWFPVTNPPTISATQWSITLPVSAEGPLVYRLKAK